MSRTGLAGGEEAKVIVIDERRLLFHGSTILVCLRGMSVPPPVAGWTFILSRRSTID